MEFNQKTAYAQGCMSGNMAGYRINSRTRLREYLIDYKYYIRCAIRLQLPKSGHLCGDGFAAGKQIQYNTIDHLTNIDFSKILQSYFAILFSLIIP